MFASNLRAICREFDIRYHKLYHALNNGSTAIKIDGVEVYKGELIKGNQRVKKQVDEDVQVHRRIGPDLSAVPDRSENLQQECIRADKD